MSASYHGSRKRKTKSAQICFSTKSGINPTNVSTLHGKPNFVMGCMVTHNIARVWINRVRLPILCKWSAKKQGEMNISLSAFAPENLVSRDGFDSPVPRQPAHLHTTQAESGAYLRDSSRVPRRRPFFMYLKPPHIRHRVSPEFIGSRNCVPMAFTAESPPAQGQ